MTLSDAANWATIFGVPISVVVSITLWYFTKESAAKFWEWAWKWITLAIVAFLAFALWHFGCLNWLCYKVTWPVWALILLGISSLLFLVALAALSEIFSQPSAQQELKPYQYRKDEIFGVEWVWSYFGEQINVDDFSAFCPKEGCKHRLESELNRNARVNTNLVGFPISLKCRRCGFQRDFECDLERLTHDAALEVERRLRTGEYIEKLKQRTSPKL
jgi:hypothetical protein